MEGPETFNRADDFKSFRPELKSAGPRPTGCRKGTTLNIGVYKFIKYVEEKFTYLDIVINNAAQTIRRPMDFYRHLMDYECIPRNHVQPKQQEVLVQQEVLNYGYYRQQLPAQTSHPSALPTVVELQSDDENNDEPSKKRRKSSDSDETSALLLSATGVQNIQPVAGASNSGSEVPFSRSMSLDSNYSNVLTTEPSTSSAATNRNTSAFTRDIVIHTGSAFSSMSQYFPRGAMDADGQQLDLRRKNSWVMRLDDVPVTEIIEVLVVNVIAPFILNKELKGLLCKSEAKRKFIVNVSAMEGQFNRENKTQFHPHTNMGKAALNMMTRTAALSYKNKNIYMTSVDTGWVTDERPFYSAKHEQRVKGFRLPLDSIDGAARIYDPIVVGYTDTESTPHYAVFLKNYAVYPW